LKFKYFNINVVRLLVLFGRSESRYLLILTENLSVLSLILDQFEEADLSPEVVFGSRFSDDVSYTQVSIQDNILVLLNIFK